jgi:hypothetical protein
MPIAEFMFEQELGHEPYDSSFTTQSLITFGRAPAAQHEDELLSERRLDESATSTRNWRSTGGRMGIDIACEHWARAVNFSLNEHSHPK